MMRYLILLLMVTMSFADEVTINNNASDGGVVNSTVNVINTVDTLYSEPPKHAVNSPNRLTPSKEYLVATIGLQYMFPFDGRDIVISDEGLGLRMYLMLHSPLYKGVMGVRFGYTQHNDVVITKNNGYEPTGYNEIDSYYDMEEELPYTAAELSVIAGGYHIQGIFGWGYFVKEHSALVGINLQTYTKIGLSASFVIMYNELKYTPEIGVGLTVSL